MSREGESSLHPASIDSTFLFLGTRLTDPFLLGNTREAY